MHLYYWVIIELGIIIDIQELHCRWEDKLFVLGIIVWLLAISLYITYLIV